MMEQVALSTGARDLFVKLCGMLGSEHGGERTTAARMATNFLRERSLTWDEIIPCGSGASRDNPSAAAPQYRHTSVSPARSGGAFKSLDWKADLAMCRNRRRFLTASEDDLLRSLTSYRRLPTTSEAVSLAKAANRLRRMPCS
jgi:hypothetical protein